MHLEQLAIEMPDESNCRRSLAVALMLVGAPSALLFLEAVACLDNVGSVTRVDPSDGPLMETAQFGKFCPRIVQLLAINSEFHFRPLLIE